MQYHNVWIPINLFKFSAGKKSGKELTKRSYHKKQKGLLKGWSCFSFHVNPVYWCANFVKISETLCVL